MALVLDRLAVASARCARTDTAVALLLVSAGDDVPATAHLLEDAIRAGDTIARINERELAVIGDDLADPAEAEALAQRALRLLGGPPAAIGLAVADAAVRDAKELLDEAGRSLARAQEHGGGCEIFDSGLHDRAVVRARAEAELRHAIASGELRLHYQPIVDVEDSLTRGVEALVRWEHPEDGLLGPDDFFGVAEESGAIVPLGDWVLRDACRQVTSWHAMHPDGEPIWLAVNVSARQLVHPGFDGMVQRALTESGLLPGLLHVEIAESDLLADAADAASALRRLRAIGVHISIDDASDGWREAASDFAVDTVKAGPDAIAGVLAVRRRDVEVVAQRVEDREQETALRELGCHLAQGFLYARPAPADELEALLVVPPLEPAETG